MLYGTISYFNIYLMLTVYIISVYLDLQRDKCFYLTLEVAGDDLQNTRNDENHFQRQMFN